MSLTDYRTLGRSGLRVSPLALGTMTFGTDWGGGANEAEARRMSDLYAERGGNFVDTANFYTSGSSETLLGRFMAGQRDRTVLATKYSLNLHPGDPNGGGVEWPRYDEEACMVLALGAEIGARELPGRADAAFMIELMFGENGQYFAPW